VREIIVAALPTIVPRFGYQWLTNVLFHAFEELRTSADFLNRGMCLMALSAISKFIPHKYKWIQVFKYMTEKLCDPAQSVVELALNLLTKHQSEIDALGIKDQLRQAVEMVIVNMDSPVRVQDSARILQRQLQTK
jgi:hypothetical protein